MTTIDTQRLLLRVAGSYFRADGDITTDKAYNSLVPKSSPVLGEGTPEGREMILEQKLIEKDLRDLDRGRRLDRVIHTMAEASRKFAKKIDPSSFGGDISMIRGENGSITPEITSRADQDGRAKQAAGLLSLLEKFSTLISSVGSVIGKMEGLGGFQKVLRTALESPDKSWTDREHLMKAQALSTLCDVIKASPADMESVMSMDDDVMVHGLTRKASLLDISASLRIVGTLLSQLNMAVDKWVLEGDATAKRCQAVAEQAASYLDSFGDDIGLLATKVATELKASNRV